MEFFSSILLTRLDLNPTGPVPSGQSRPALAVRRQLPYCNWEQHLLRHYYTWTLLSLSYPVIAASALCCCLSLAVWH